MTTPHPAPQAEKLTAEENPVGRLVAHVATAQAERDAARADLAALQQVIDQQAAQLDASRAETEAVKRDMADALGDLLNGCYVASVDGPVPIAPDRARVERAIAAFQSYRGSFARAARAQGIGGEKEKGNG